MWIFVGMITALPFIGLEAVARQVPTDRSSANSISSVIAPGHGSDAPALIQIPSESLQPLFRVDKNYDRPASVKVIGAYAIDEPPNVHFIGAWGRGFIPETIEFSDGRCFAFNAEYTYGKLSNGRLNSIPCAEHPKTTLAASSSGPPPAGSPLRFVGAGWGYAAWVNDKADITFVTPPHSDKFQPFFTAKLTALAFLAMNGVDDPGGNLTLFARLNGRLTLITLDATWDISNSARPAR